MPLILRLLSVALLALLAASFGIACSDDDPSEEDAEAALCGDLEELRSAMTDFGGTLSPDSSVDDLQDSRDDVSGAFDDVRESAAGVAGVSIDDFETAWDDFVETIDSIGQDDSIADAINSVRDAATELGDAYTQSFDGVDCP